MTELKNLNDLLVHEIQVLYNAEKLQLIALQRLINKTSSAELKAAFQQHMEETQVHKERLEKVGRLLNIDADDEGNPAIKGLILESEKNLHKDATPETLDAALIASVQKVEHYEISAYGTASYLAQELGFTDIANLLGETLKEEKETDMKLNNLAKSRINLRARATSK